MAIELKDLTGGEVAGAGAFDELMRAHKAHIQQEYDAGRMTDQNYATAYIGGLQTILQVANQFVLQSPVQAQNELLVQKQIDEIDARIAQINKQTESITKDIEMKQIQIDDILPKQAAQLDAQITLTNAQKLQVDAQTAVATVQASQIAAQTSLVGKQEDLVDEQILGAKDQHTDPTGGLNKAQFDKLNEEKDLLTQRIVTEEAQTTGTATSVGGLIGSEIALRENQGDSFTRDAEQKAAKFYSDVFSVVFSINPDSGTSLSNPVEWGFGWDDSEQVMQKLRAGIGLP